MEILKIHASGLAKHGDIDYEAVVSQWDFPFALGPMSHVYYRFL